MILFVAYAPLRAWKANDDDDDTLLQQKISEYSWIFKNAVNSIVLPNRIYSMQRCCLNLILQCRVSWKMTNKCINLWSPNCTKSYLFFPISCTSTRRGCRLWLLLLSSFVAGHVACATRATGRCGSLSPRLTINWARRCCSEAMRRSYNFLMGEHSKQLQRSPYQTDVRILYQYSVKSIVREQLQQNKSIAKN